MKIYRRLNTWGNLHKLGGLYEILKIEWPSGRRGELATIRNIVTGKVESLAVELLEDVSKEETKSLLEELRESKSSELSNIEDALTRFGDKYGY